MLSTTLRRICVESRPVMQRLYPAMTNIHFKRLQQTAVKVKSMEQTNLNIINSHDKAVENNPFELNEKKQWNHSRFGALPHTKFGDIKECIREDAMQWPHDLNLVFHSCKGYTVSYRMVDVATEAERVAEIYQSAIDEMIGNSDYIWHHRPNEIREQVASGRVSVWGMYSSDDDDRLIGVLSAEFLYGQRGVHVIWGAVDPVHRGKGVWENIGVFIDTMIEKTGAQYGLVWMATTHNLSQRMIEKAGWKPVGCFEGGEFLGGSDGKYYRQTVIWYSKLYGDGVTYKESNEDMVLTPACQRVANAVLSG